MRANKGFTLLELLVVMTLLSLLMTGMISALRTMAQTENRVDLRLTELNDTRAVNHFLQTILTRMAVNKMDAPNAVGKTRLPFFASANSVTWAGVMPARPDIGGLHFFHLAVELVADHQELVLRFAPIGPDMQLPDWSSSESRILMHNIADFAITAQGLPVPGSESFANWPIGWQNGWPVLDALPEQLRLEISNQSGGILSLTVDLLALPQADNSLSVTVIGGSRR